MEYLLWFGIFLALALLATVPVHFHLSSMNRRAAGDSPKAVAPKATRPCPQCKSPVAVDSAFCDQCGVPMALWTLKKAREANGDVVAGRVVPIIDQDVCIGCSACVNACNEGVLEIIAGKSAVVNVSACTSAGTCAEVCPTGACQLGGSGGGRRVEVPQIDDDFQTNQAGLYAVGELGGLGLIKNAISEGQLVVDRILESHERREGMLDLVIVGSGPAGLSAGLAAKAAGLEFVILEQGNLANTIRRYPNRKVVMAEPIKIPLYGSLWISDAPKEALLSVWQTIIDTSGLVVHEFEKVEHVERQTDGTFVTRTPKAEYHSLKVILAIGKRGTPNQLSVPGKDLPKVLYTLSDAAQYRSSRVLVVGGGDSAVEAAVALGKEVSNEVTLSYRRTEFARIRDKNREALDRAVEAGQVHLLLGSRLREVRAKEALLECTDGELRTLENDYVFAFLGGSSPRAFLEKVGVSMVTKEVPMTNPGWEETRA